MRKNFNTNKIRSFFASCFIACFALALINLPAATAKPLTLKLAHESIAESQWGMSADWFAKEVEFRTKGRVKVEVYPACQLGTAAELVEGVKLGLVDIIWSYPSMISRFVPEFGALDVTFLFANTSELMDFARSDIAKELNEKLIKKGIRNLGYSLMGERHLTSNKAVYSPDDLKGEKIRSIPTPVAMQCVKSMGATPTPVAWEETYGALESGIVTGQENPIGEIIDAKFYQVQKFMIMTGHQLMFTMHPMNERKFQKLSAEDQKIILDVTRDMTFYTLGLVDEKAKSGLKFLKGQLKVITTEDGLDIEAFRKKALNEIPAKFEDQWGPLYRRIVERYSK